ncbi:hypothetical protein DPEC_G00276410 [Dallia pectoralis]|uniref:Uncharacterized protein n=1 Tax=Dallia pectoralis TaxID=75939 RepID=A0ACC2FLU9_DALPE|nr:hypothetical protein DPEC_G00276410 [Dallia pectoralis]
MVAVGGDSQTSTLPPNRLLNTFPTCLEQDRGRSSTGTRDLGKVCRECCGRAGPETQSPVSQKPFSKRLF